MRTDRQIDRQTAFHLYIVDYIYIIVINGQSCTDVVGSLSHDNNIVIVGQTYILAGYTVPCNSTVVAWEFCYQMSSATSVTFYPGIWTSGMNNDYELIQSNSITYDSTGSTSNMYPCQRVILSEADQFTAPAGSVVGLYSGFVTQLLHTSTNSSITTHRFNGNQSSVRADNNDDVNYNITIRVHLGKHNA